MLVIICWNIEKFTVNTAREFGDYLLSVIGSGSGPLLVFILENKTQPQAVIAALRKSGVGSGLNYGYMSVGGSTHRRENIIVAYRGLELTNVTLHEDWGAAWTQRTTAVFGTELTRALELYGLQLARPRRSAPVLRQPPPFRAPDAFRSPLLVQFRLGLHEYAVVAMHAPGPSDGEQDWAGRRYTELYMQAVLSTLPDWVGVVVGDFNLYGASPDSTGFVDLSRGTGGTTLTDSHERTTSRLDRVLARPKISGGVELFAPFSGAPSSSSRFSDHYGVGFSVRWMPDIGSIRGSSLIPWTARESERDYDELLFESTQLERALGQSGKRLGQSLSSDAERVLREAEAWMRSWLGQLGISLPWNIQYRACQHLSFGHGEAIALPEGWSFGAASGVENNCLIDTLLQLVAPEFTEQERPVFASWIRTQLNVRHGVPLDGYLMAGVHSLLILQIIQSAGIAINPADYAVHALAVINGVQIEETTGNGDTDLFLFCNGNHYDPIHLD